MKALDIGCGSEPELWLAGADLCDSDLAMDYNAKELSGHELLFPQDIDALHPHLPVEDNTYDLVQLSSSWCWMVSETKQIVANELARIVKPGGIVIIVDSVYLEEHMPEWETFDIEKFLEEQMQYFPEKDWGGIRTTYYNTENHPGGNSKAYPYILHLHRSDD